MIVQFQGEDRKQAIINHFSLDIEEEEDFFEYMESMGYSIDDDDELLEKLHLMWWSKKENQTEYDAARAYLIKEGLDPDQLVKEGLVFIKTVQENQSLRSELQKQKELERVNSNLSFQLVIQNELNGQLIKHLEIMATRLANMIDEKEGCPIEDDEVSEAFALIKKYKES